ncbi:hypothetical protein BDR07DRAFT_1378780 [Suillus spraguei]|nr:hypothetical protein BDR07DRAFT_1378780 [Suillus spraguei]
MSQQQEKRLAEEDLFTSNANKRYRTTSNESYRKSSHAYQDQDSDDFRYISPDLTISWQDQYELRQTVHRLEAEVQNLLNDRERMQIKHREEVESYKSRFSSLEDAALRERTRRDDLQAEFEYQQANLDVEQTYIKHLRAGKKRDWKDITTLLEIVSEKNMAINDLSDQIDEVIQRTASGS